MIASPRIAVLVLAGLFAVVSTGCFKSLTLQASSESTSDSISSPFKSSSDSSSPDDDVARDVRDATELWAIRGGDVDTLRRNVGRIAREYGVSDWEHHAATYQAIGRGLRRSELEGDALASVKSELAAATPQALAWIEAGYASDGLN